jgi:hypothetical protein
MLENKIYLVDGSYLDISISYRLGGWNTKRGYYLSVMRCRKITQCGVDMIETDVYDLANKTILLKEVTRKSKKAEIEAENIAREKFPQYITA